MAPITAPTSLPPLRRLAEYSAEDVARCLRGIRQLYWPPPPSLPPNLAVPTRRANRPKLLRLYSDDKIPDSGYASADESDVEEAALDSGDSDSSDSLDELRADPLERTFAIKWLTGLMGRIDELSSDDPTIDADDTRESLLDDTTALLARFSRHEEDEADYDITRTFSFPSKSGTIRIELNDAPLSNADHTSVGLQSWGSAIVLAERLCASPASFNLLDAQPLRVLELGAGTGLLSIAVAKLLPHPDTIVVATDYHPAILTNLAANLRTNFPGDRSGARVSALELDWASPARDAPFDAPFDVVLAADVVYHPEHARWIRGCVARMLRRPSSKSKSDSSADPGGVFHLIVPVRTSGRHEGMDGTVDEVFKRDRETDDPVDAADADAYRLGILDTAAVERQGVGIGRADEAGYRLFRIGWVL
ncbi:putative methyltransferase-domain-containing protein [Mycena alexandri]|uniref:Methyltransferase-domain-containing protein n=1 Tax=Mycena alexandri TaxID=1745969 RepID=A0AAD6TJM1_9AGAR|nr:putative methyltransferase-domain-containing protein [Mycena alexandri]